MAAKSAAGGHSGLVALNPDSIPLTGTLRAITCRAHCRELATAAGCTEADGLALPATAPKQ